MQSERPRTGAGMLAMSRLKDYISHIRRVLASCSLGERRLRVPLGEQMAGDKLLSSRNTRLPRRPSAFE